MTDNWREMTFEDAKIGLEFRCGDARWRITDVGTRVVVAIKIDPHELTDVAEDGSKSIKRLTFKEADAEGWFNGPPYAVGESVFDEYDLPGCEIEV